MEKFVEGEPAMVSLDNGNSYKLASELTREEVGYIVDWADRDICEELHPTYLAGEEPNEWAEAYLLAHGRKYGEIMVTW